MPALTEAEKHALAFAEEVRRLADGVVKAAVAVVQHGQDHLG